MVFVSAHGRSQSRPNSGYFLLPRANIARPGLFSDGFSSIMDQEGVCAYVCLCWQTNGELLWDFLRVPLLVLHIGRSAS